MDKFKVAHEWAMKFGKSTTIMDRENTVDYAWQYADAMQAEADKRKEKGVPDALLTKDENGNCTHFHTTLDMGECFDCGKVLNMADSTQLEWQLDWSVAPSWANFAAIQKDLHVLWCESKPEISTHGDWFVCGGRSVHRDVFFNYQGDWRNSLRKRPQ